MQSNKIKIMKKHILFLMLAAQSCLAIAQKDKVPFMTKSFSNETIKNAEVQTSGGSITITGVAAAEARVEVYVYSNNNNQSNLSKDEVQQRLNQLYDLTINVTNGKLTAIAKSKEQIRDWKKALNISFKVFVPKEISSELSTSGGSISLVNLSGNQDFSTSGGSLHINNLSGKINGRTSGGSIDLENSKNDIELTTSGGSIEAKNCEGKLRLSTSGGSLNLKDLKGDIMATTSGGSVNGKTISGELVTHTSGGSIHLTDISSSLEASTSAGSITVSMKELGKYIKIKNSGGNVDLELPKNKGIDLELSGSRIKTDHMENFTGKIQDDEIDGKLNGGGVPVTIKAGSGKIYLALK